MSPDDRSEDPEYRAAVLLGRRQALNDVMRRLAASGASDPDASIAALVEWCAQTEQEIEDEMQLVIKAHQASTR